MYTIVTMNQLSTDRRAQDVRALCEGNWIRSTSRMTGVAINTVIKLLTDLGAACLDDQDAAMRSLPCKPSPCLSGPTDTLPGFQLACQGARPYGRTFSSSRASSSSSASGSRGGAVLRTSWTSSADNP